MSIKDLEPLVIDTMGEDIWLAILDFTEETIAEKTSESEYTKEEIKDYDGQLVSLRSGIRDEIITINEIIKSINSAKRINRDSIIVRLEGITKRLYDNEGYC
nr:hypothetical protein [Clostridium gasigenes]